MSTKLKVPQARILKALVSAGQSICRAKLNAMAGFTPASGTINRALHGVAKGSKHTGPHKGLLGLGYVRCIALKVEDGIREEYEYEATAAGKKALDRFLKTRKLPELRSRKASTNHRFQYAS